MKKMAFIICTLVFFQMTSAQNTIIGVKGGVNYSGFNGSNRITELSNFKYKVGGHVGVFVTFEIQDKIAIQPELLFSMQGSRIGPENISVRDANGEFFAFRYKTVYDLYYLNLPVMGKYQVNEKFSLEFGPQFGYQLVGKEKNRILDRGNLPQDIFEDLNDRDVDIEGAQKFDLGINVGMGYAIDELLTLGLRYNYGVTKVFDRGSPFKNSVLQLNLSYKLN